MRVDARPGVLDRELDVRSGHESVCRFLIQHDVLGTHPYRTAIGHRITRVEAEVHEHALDLAGVGENGPGVWGERRFYRDGLADQAPEGRYEAEHVLVDVHALGHHHLLAAEREQLLGQLGGATRRTLNRLHIRVQWVGLGKIPREKRRAALDDR